ncbi:hypothetical protein [Paeniglutamicibacter terrestris]|uniref:SdpI family protein n=1 Tax=Paeniglutamicibacter terrestris TaxID=2723403 RepID=A0ABX1G3Z2_9MICC|nr:hypothetical protein [Paeniglutamicibacter terrestris]NKG20939.1 hypothetical protein [Paeniglutamicibacter terrestris]
MDALRSAFCFLFFPLLVMSCALGFDSVMWIIPVLVARGIALVRFVHGFLKLKRDRSGTVQFPQWNGRDMFRVGGHQLGDGIASCYLAAIIFFSGALVAGIASSPEFVLYSTTCAILLAAMSPFMFVVIRIMHRRRELYTAWLLPNGRPVEISPRNTGNSDRP